MVICMYVFMAMDLPLPDRLSKTSEDSKDGITSATERVDRTVREVVKINDHWQRMIMMLRKVVGMNNGDLIFKRTSL